MIRRAGRDLGLDLECHRHLRAHESGRWALAWFEQFGFGDGQYGVAETLSKAKNTSVAGMVEARILTSKGGKVRLFKPAELPEDWDPTRDPRLSVWEMVQHLIRVFEAGGEGAAAVARAAAAWVSRDAARGAAGRPIIDARSPAGTTSKPPRTTGGSGATCRSSFSSPMRFSRRA
jgi:hypothetical protein